MVYNGNMGGPVHFQKTNTKNPRRSLPKYDKFMYEFLLNKTYPKIICIPLQTCKREYKIEPFFNEIVLTCVGQYIRLKIEL